MTEHVIAAITQVHLRDGSNEQREVFMESLRELVKLAKNEVLIDMKFDTAIAIGWTKEMLPILEPFNKDAQQQLSQFAGDPGKPG